MLPKNTKQWVLWKREEVLKQGVPTGELTKVPYTPSGKKASSTNEATWSLYSDVSQVRHEFDGIGFVFDGAWLGVDLDHVLVAGKIEDKKSRKFIDEANTLTEISPSGDGLHLYFKLSEPLELAANAHKPNKVFKYECYSEKRYFTVTENLFENKGEIRTIDSVTAYKLLGILGYPWKKKTTTQVEPKKSEATSSLSDEDVLRIMFSAKNGKRMQDIYNGIDTYHENDASVADAALCSMFAFYTNKDRVAIERLWLASPRGSREKVRVRVDYRRKTIDFAIEKTEETFKENKDEKEFDYYVVQEGKKGETIIPVIVENIRYFLNTHKDFKERFRFEEFKQIIEWKRFDTWEQIKDESVLFVMNAIVRAHPYFARVNKETVADAMLACAKQYSYDEVLTYFQKTVWDKKPRLDTWLTTVFGVEDDEYHKAVGSNWLKGLVKRAISPGCKFDYVLVIEGKQGIKKSMAFAALADPWHIETVATPDNKDFFMSLIGNLVVEFAEGETLSRGEMKKLKAVITMTHDDIRLPYAHMVTRYPRRCVFAMTTNEDQYLKDNTGNRRWLPVQAVFDEANIEWLKENRDQLFAEAYSRVLAKETYWEFPQEEMEKQQSMRVLSDPRVEPILEWYANLSYEKKIEGVTTREAFDALQPVNSFGERRGNPMNKGDQIAIASILKNSLYLIKKFKTVNRVQQNAFIPTTKTPIEVPISAESAKDLFDTF